jgi:hypothetical protein
VKFFLLDIYLYLNYKTNISEKLIDSRNFEFNNLTSRCCDVFGFP